MKIEKFKNAVETFDYERAKLMFNGLEKELKNLLFIDYIIEGKTDYIKFMVSLGFNVNNEHVKYAARHSRFDLIKYFIENFNINVNYEKGVIISTICNKIFNKSKSEEHKNTYHFRKHQVEIVKFLIEHGSDIHVFNEEPLSNAIKCNNIELVKLLIKNGADIKFRENNDLISPLSDTIDNNNFELFEYLILQGIDINYDDSYTLKCALFYYSRDKKYSKYVKLLLNNKCIITNDLSDNYKKYIKELIIESRNDKLKKINGKN